MAPCTRSGSAVDAAAFVGPDHVEVQLGEDVQYQRVQVVGMVGWSLGREAELS